MRSIFLALTITTAYALLRGWPEELHPVRPDQPQRVADFEHALDARLVGLEQHQREALRPGARARHGARVPANGRRLSREKEPGVRANQQPTPS